jgi:hypothetical protein
MAATAHLTVVDPDNEKCTVQSAPARLPKRKPNAEYRSREHLTEREVFFKKISMCSMGPFLR